MSRAGALAIALLAGALARVAPAAAEEVAPTARDPVPGDSTAADEGDDDDDGELDLGGRVFVRESLASMAGGDWTGEAALESARLGVTYRRKKRLRAEVTLEARRGDASVRDAYLQLRLGHGAWVRGGRFKMPMSSVELTSAWTLPTADRGVLDDVLDEGLGAAGRRIGFAGGWRGQGALTPALELGLFQGQDAEGDEQAGRLADGAGLTVAGRVSIEVPTVVVGLAGSSRVNQASAALPLARHWTASVDGELDVPLPGGGVRAWAEVLAGSSGFDTTPETGGDPLFVAARAIVAWRVGGVDRGDGFVEPYAMAAVLEPNLDNARDVTWEAVVGVGVGHWRRYRLQLQGELRRTGDFVPPGLAGDGEPIEDRTGVTLQLGAAF